MTSMSYRHLSLFLVWVVLLTAWNPSDELNHISHATIFWNILKRLLPFCVVTLPILLYAELTEPHRKLRKSPYGIVLTAKDISATAITSPVKLE